MPLSIIYCIIHMWRVHKRKKFRPVLLMASKMPMTGFAAYGNTVCRQMAALT